MVAAFGERQPQAARYQALFKRSSAEGWSLATTWPCVVEAAYLLSPPERYTLLSWVASDGVTVFPFAQESLEAMVELMRRYTEAPRTQMDLADASLVWLANDTGVVRIMTLDQRDFSRYRLADGRSFEIL
jgi:uncharacterized protein